MLLTKICFKCDNEKSITEFHKDKNNPDGHKTACKLCRRKSDKQYYLENKEVIKEKCKNWKRNNQDKVGANNRKWQKDNQDKVAIKVAKWRKNNPEKYKSIQRKGQKNWRKNNLGKKASFTAKYRATKLQATPPWLTKSDYATIEAFYIQARELTESTGIQHHVDHIIPLQGENVSGLHVPWNLQILTASENLAKSNKIEGVA